MLRRAFTSAGRMLAAGALPTLPCIFLFSILVFSGTGCAFPSSKGTQVSVAGQLVDRRGAPLPGRSIELVLPAEYGLSDIDMTYGEAEEYGRQSQRALVQTDALGSFSHTFHPVRYSTAFWLIPPLGNMPKSPPLPYFFLRLIEEPTLLYAILVDEDEVTYAVHNRKPALKEPPIPASRPPCRIDGTLRRETRDDLEASIAELSLQSPE